LILEQINLNKEKYYIDTKLIILVNKCDNLSITNNDIIIDTETNEYQDLYLQIQNTVKNHNKTNIDYDIIPISCENAFIYNLLNNSPGKLNEKQLNKIGINYYGKIYWNKLKNIDEKKNRLIEFNKNNRNEVDYMMINTGYELFKINIDKLYTLNYNTFLMNNYKKSSTILIKSLCEKCSNYLVDDLYDTLLPLLKSINVVFHNSKHFIKNSLVTNFINNDKLHNDIDKLINILCDKIIKIQTDKTLAIDNYNKYIRYLNTIKPLLYYDFNIDDIIQMLTNSVSYYCCNELYSIISCASPYNLDDVERYLCILYDIDKNFNIRDAIVGLLSHTLVFYNDNNKKNHFVISSKIMNWKNIFKLSNKFIFELNLEYILKMYSELSIVENKYKSVKKINYLGNDKNMLLYQMETFWHSEAVKNILNKNTVLNKYKEKIELIKYLSSSCRIIVMNQIEFVVPNNYVKFELLLEESIVDYLTNL